MKYAFIKQHHQRYAVTRLCDALDVSSSGYYDWLDRPESPNSRDNKRLVYKIKHLHQRSRAIMVRRRFTKT
ncbi:MAG: hypothetical protein JKY93_11025 [Gammaproteobacteria bacterium]|nr:hypothetical protein [Gammaproteobacteria bacterium]